MALFYILLFIPSLSNPLHISHLSEISIQTFQVLEDDIWPVATILTNTAWSILILDLVTLESLPAWAIIFKVFYRPLTRTVSKNHSSGGFATVRATHCTKIATQLLVNSDGTFMSHSTSSILTNSCSSLSSLHCHPHHSDAFFSFYYSWSSTLMLTLLVWLSYQPENFNCFSDMLTTNHELPQQL